MKELHPTVLKKIGEEILQDACDIRRLRQARKADKNKPSLTLAQVKKRLGL